ncbi:MAG: hypothetical protein O3C34_02035 [Proteobacteria bacterium]|nr:hypothetical protein [Pseudomonadota bacterium]
MFETDNAGALKTMPNGNIDTFDALFDVVKTEGTATFTDLKDGIMDIARDVIIPQMREIATAVWDVMEGLAAGDYTPEGAAELLDMSRRAIATVIAGATELVFSEVQAAITRIYRALFNLVSGAVQTAINAVL